MLLVLSSPASVRKLSAVNLLLGIKNGAEDHLIFAHYKWPLWAFHPAGFPA